MVSFAESSRRTQALKLLPVLFILAIAVVQVLPHYIGGDWPWNNPPGLVAVNQLKTLQSKGLTLPGWRSIDQQVLRIGGRNWSIQAITPEAVSPDEAGSQPPLTLMLQPQVWHKDQPQVEWMDINGVQRWTADSQRHLNFTATVPPSEAGSNSSQNGSDQVSARFLRGWTPQQTYAVVQWYAWPGGGSSSPSRWFWVDQFSQWRHHQRASWVAVSLLLPIKPLGDIEQSREFATAMAQDIQIALRQDALQISP